MECDGSDSKSVDRELLHDGSGKKIRLGLNVEDSLSPKPRFKRMDGVDKKSGLRKRLKQDEAEVDSGDDDEPIKTMLRFRSKKTLKKVQMGLNRGSDKGKDEDLGVVEPAEDNEDLGSMNITLASIKKKLKGSKKNSGSGTAAGRNSSKNVAEPSGNCLNGLAKGDIVQDAHNKTIHNVTESDNEGITKRPAISPKIWGNGNGSKSKHALEDQRLEDNVIENHRDCVPGSSEGPNNSLGENFEDPLVAYFQKVQPKLTKKSRSSLRSKERRRRHLPNDDLSSNHCLVPEVDSPLVIKRSRSGEVGSDDIMHQLSRNTPEGSAHDQSKDTAIGKISVCTQEANSLPSNCTHDCASAPVVGEVTGFISNFCDGYSETGLDTSVPNSQLSTCSNRKLQDGEVNRPTSGHPDADTVDLHGSNCLFGGNDEGFPCLPGKEITVPIQDTISEVQPEDCLEVTTINLAHDVDMQNSTTSPEQPLEFHQFDVHVANVGSSSDANHSENLLTDTSKLLASDGKEFSGYCADDSLNGAREDVSLRTSMEVPGRNLELSSKSQSDIEHEKIQFASQHEDRPDFDQCPKDTSPSHDHASSFALELPMSEGTYRDGDNVNQTRSSTWVEKPDLASVVIEKEETSTYEGVVSPLPPYEVDITELAVQNKHLKKSVTEGKGNHCLQEQPNEIASSIQCNQNELAADASGGTLVPRHDSALENEEGNTVSSLSLTPDHNENAAEDAGSLLQPETKDNEQSQVQRAMRKAKKRRHEDMAYEGDVDWEILIHKQAFFESFQVGESDHYIKTREKSNSSSTMAVETENRGAAAVSVGLKARAAGPVEKIKFKEVLKRKGGLQEYLECRNHILALWSKDVRRILLITDCGVTATPSVHEPLRASLIREIYAFLDQSGYINIGVASKRERTDPNTNHKSKILKDKKSEEVSDLPIEDLDDGPLFNLRRGRNPEVSLEARGGLILDDEDVAAGAMKDTRCVASPGGELSYQEQPEVSKADRYPEQHISDAKAPHRLAELDISSSDLTSGVLNVGTLPVKTSNIRNNLRSVHPASVDQFEENHRKQCDTYVRKRIIIIGAGPAGLAAGRHLQRQGFSVTILEARSRIGGRVYTDRSSLSVPVDLGASIITGVEADVATERRPDPSSLICSQLGLELTVLNSDCPLYDIDSGQKVPIDLDEALEAEYNSLLDDMVLLVAQKGEHAMRMSLEDGLEFALKRRRMARLGRNDVENNLPSSVNSVDSEIISDGNFSKKCSFTDEILSPLERRVMDWHFANLEYGCAALLKEVSLPYWNQDDVYGGFGGAHCMIKGGYSTVTESLAEGLCIHLNHVVTNVSYFTKDLGVNDDQSDNVKVSTSNGSTFYGDAVLITVPLGCLKAESIKFSPQLPDWKRFSIQRLGFGVLNKVVLEFSNVFWDDSVDYFGATAEDTDQRGHCFMFWNVKKTAGAPVLIALVVGKAATDGQSMSPSDHVNHALVVLRKLFGECSVPDPVASVVTDWGRDPFSYGAYSYVAVGASGEDYDILGRPVENCLFFAGEATCKEHPDTVGGAMMSGLREAVRIIDILSTGNDFTAEVEAMEAAQRHSDSERNELRDILKRLEAVEFSNVLYKNSFDGAQILTKETLLQEMFFNAKTTAGRLHLVKELLNLPVKALKSFAGTKEGLNTLNSWILDSLGKDGTQLLRRCVRLLVLVSTDLLAVRLSGIGKTVKEKVCVHTSRDIRAIASQLVNVWVEVFRREKASNGGLKLLKQPISTDSSKGKSNLASGKAPLSTNHSATENKLASASVGHHFPSGANTKRVNSKPIKFEAGIEAKSEGKSKSQGSLGRLDGRATYDQNLVMTEEEQAAFAAAEAARAAALAAAEAYASSEAKCSMSLQLPKIPSFHKFARREQYAQMDESDVRKKWPGSALGKQDCISEIDSRNCRVRDWSVDFSAACANIDNSKLSVDNHSQQSQSNELAGQLNFREHSGESVAVDSSLLTKAWVDAAGSMGIKDYSAIERWQSQAVAAETDFFHQTMYIRDEEDSSIKSNLPPQKLGGLANESSISQVTVNRELVGNLPRGVDRIKHAVVDYVASLLMPLYKARKIDKEGYKSIMKKTATKVMEQTTDAEKTMAVYEFLDSKRKNKIRSFVDKLIERHMSVVKPFEKS